MFNSSISFPLIVTFTGSAHVAHRTRESARAIRLAGLRTEGDLRKTPPAVVSELKVTMHVRVRVRTLFAHLERIVTLVWGPDAEARAGGRRLQQHDPGSRIICVAVLD